MDMKTLKDFRRLLKKDIEDTVKNEDFDLSNHLLSQKDVIEEYSDAPYIGQISLPSAYEYNWNLIGGTILKLSIIRKVEDLNNLFTLVFDFAENCSWHGDYEEYQNGRQSDFYFFGSGGEISLIFSETNPTLNVHTDHLDPEAEDPTPIAYDIEHTPYMLSYMINPQISFRLNDVGEHFILQYDSPWEYDIEDPDEAGGRYYVTLNTYDVGYVDEGIFNITGFYPTITVNTSNEYELLNEYAPIDYTTDPSVIIIPEGSSTYINIENANDYSTRFVKAIELAPGTEAEAGEEYLYEDHYEVAVSNPYAPVIINAGEQETYLYIGCNSNQIKILKQQVVCDLANGPQCIFRRLDGNTDPNYIYINYYNTWTYVNGNQTVNIKRPGQSSYSSIRVWNERNCSSEVSFVAALPWTAEDEMPADDDTANEGWKYYDHFELTLTPQSAFKENRPYTTAGTGCAEYLYISARSLPTE